MEVMCCGECTVKNKELILNLDVWSSFGSKFLSFKHLDSDHQSAQSGFQNLCFHGKSCNFFYKLSLYTENTNMCM